MKRSSHSCVECDEIISNPICPSCLAVQMRIMVKEHDPKLAQQIISEAASSIEGETNCISCGKKMGLCAHCFSKDIYDYLNDKNTNLAEEFLSRFDFDLRRELC